MDKQMPLMDGFEATRRIRELEAKEKRPWATYIISVSADGGEEKAAAIEAGSDRVMPKPLYAKDIMKIVKYVQKRQRPDKLATS